jgi:hypothetical protein
LRLLLTQQKACDYISALAVTLASADTNSDRSSMLTALADQFAAFNTELSSYLQVTRSNSSKRGS